jgi:hypothetical protein
MTLIQQRLSRKRSRGSEMMLPYQRRGLGDSESGDICGAKEGH